MKITKLFAACAALTLILTGCHKPTPTPDKPGTENTNPGGDNGGNHEGDNGGNQGGSEQQPEELESGYIFIYDADGKEISKTPIASGASFTSEGYILFYASDYEGLSIEDYKNGEFEGAQVLVAGLIMPASNGNSISLTQSDERFQLVIQIPGLDIESHNRGFDPDIAEGNMSLSADRVNLFAVFKAEFTMTDGRRVAFNLKADYATGGEIDNLIEFADWGVCLCRSAFYIEPAKEGCEPLLIFCPPYFEYATDLPTSIFYAKLEAKSVLFDGEPHSIKELTNAGDLDLSVWHGEPGKDEESWPVVKGEIKMKKISEHFYNVEVTDGKTSSFSGSMPFSLSYNGELQDGTIQKPLPDNKFTVDNTDEHIIGSVVIDLRSSDEISFVYLCEEGGIKTVEQMSVLNSVKVTVSRAFLCGAAGLSTDSNLAITYNGREWSKAAGNDVGSYICDELDFNTGWYSLRIRNFGTFSLDFNGTATILQ